MESDSLLKNKDNDSQSDKFSHQLSLLENWLRYQKHLPQNFGTTSLSFFLRGCKMDLQKAQKKLERYCYLPVTHEKFFKVREQVLDGILNILDDTYYALMPELTSDGYMIAIVKHFDSERYEILPSCQYGLLLFDYILHKGPVPEGQIFVFDMEQCDLRLCAKAFSSTFLQYISLGINVYPFRVKQAIVIIGNPILEQAIKIGVNMCKSVLPKKLKNRIHILGTKDELNKYIPEKSLPSDYNGLQKSMSEVNNDWKELLLKSVDFFESLNEMKPTGPIPSYIPQCDDTLGIDGSFRKLNVD